MMTHSSIEDPAQRQWKGRPLFFLFSLSSALFRGKLRDNITICRVHSSNILFKKKDENDTSWLATKKNAC